jgi:hypothetical protein
MGGREKRKAQKAEISKNREARFANFTIIAEQAENPKCRVKLEKILGERRGFVLSRISSTKPIQRERVKAEKI